MKKSLLSLIGLCLTSLISAQITLEHSYPSSAGSNPASSFTLIRIDSNEYRYVYLNYPNSSFTLYHLNHSVDQTITIPVPYQVNVSQYNILNISRSLFDCDSNNIEYLLTYLCNPQPCITGGYVEVFRQDGTSLFHADSAQAYSVYGGIGVISLPVYQTPNGTKMKLIYQGSNEVKVFSLCGNLYPVLSVLDNIEGMLGNSFPNPTQNLITIPYTLPHGTNEGIITLYSSDGKKLHEYIIDRMFDHLKIDVSTFSAGPIYYQLTTTAGESIMQQLIKY